MEPTPKGSALGGRDAPRRGLGWVQAGVGGSCSHLPSEPQEVTFLELPFPKGGQQGGSQVKNEPNQRSSSPPTLLHPQLGHQKARQGVMGEPFCSSNLKWASSTGASARRRTWARERCRPPSPVTGLSEAETDEPVHPQPSPPKLYQAQEVGTLSKAPMGVPSPAIERTTWWWASKNFLPFSLPCHHKRCRVGSANFQ